MPLKDLSVPGLRHRRATLANDLRVVTVELPHLHSVYLGVYVRAGSRHEAPERMGVSHFLEHMFFRGSERYPDTVAMNALVESAGGNLNGVTMRDHGYYDTRLHPDELETGFDVIGDMLATPRLTSIDTERKVILEEMSDELDERGRDVDVDNLSKMALFPGHGLSHKIAGTRRTVRAISLADLKHHHRRMYCARNMVLVCVGRVRHARVMRLAQTHFGGLAPGRVARDLSPPPRPRGPSVQLIDDEDSPQTTARLSFLAPPETHADYPALDLARRVLDAGLSSRLPFEVVEKLGLAYDVSAEIDPFSDLSVFEVESTATHAKVPRVLAVVARVLADLASKGPTRAELARVKRQAQMSQEFSLDAPSRLADWFGATELWRPAESLAEHYARLAAVTADDVRRVASRVFARSNLTAVVVGRGGPARLKALRAQVASLPLPP